MSPRATPQADIPTRGDRKRALSTPRLPKLHQNDVSVFAPFFRVGELDAAKGQAVADEICRAGQRALHITTNVADEASCQPMAQRVRDQLGRIDTLVNNAAFISGQTFNVDGGLAHR